MPASKIIVEVTKFFTKYQRIEVSNGEINQQRAESHICSCWYANSKEPEPAVCSSQSETFSCRPIFGSFTTLTKVVFLSAVTLNFPRCFKECLIKKTRTPLCQPAVGKLEKMVLSSISSEQSSINCQDCDKARHNFKTNIFCLMIHKVFY